MAEFVGFFFPTETVCFTVTCYKNRNVFYLGNGYVSYSLCDVLLYVKME